MGKNLEKLKNFNLVGVKSINIKRAKIKLTKDVIAYVNNSSYLYFGDVENEIKVKVNVDDGYEQSCKLEEASERQLERYLSSLE